MNTYFKPKVYTLLKIIATLSLIAMGVTLWLTYIHYKPDASEFCHFTDRWNCDIVNKSEWSVVDPGFAEIPVAILGFGTYFILFLGSVGVLRKWNFQKIFSWLRSERVIDFMKYLAYMGFLFSLYLTYIEAFVLHTFCFFCVVQQMIILVIAGMFLCMPKRQATT